MKKAPIGLSALALLLLGTFESRAMDQTREAAETEQTTAPELKLEEQTAVRKETHPETRITAILTPQNIVQLWDVNGEFLKQSRLNLNEDERVKTFEFDTHRGHTQLIIGTTARVYQIGLPLYPTRAEALKKERKEKEETRIMMAQRDATVEDIKAIQEGTLPSIKLEDEKANIVAKQVNMGVLEGYIATLSKDGKVRLWDAEGELIRVMPGNYTTPAEFTFGGGFLTITTSEGKEEFPMPFAGYTTREKLERGAAEESK